MNKKVELAFNASIISLYVLALIFLGLYVHIKFGNNLYLVLALGCTLVGNILNLVKNVEKKK